MKFNMLLLNLTFQNPKGQIDPFYSRFSFSPARLYFLPSSLSILCMIRLLQQYFTIQQLTQFDLDHHRSEQVG